MRRTGLITVFASALWVGACSRDQGRDVKPMEDPLRKSVAAPAEAPTGIMPLDQVRKSQAAAVSQRIADTEITITYSRPVARGRALFGALVPYDTIWNPGADQATAIAFTRDVHVNGQPVTAGKYSLWVLPGPERWTMIFSTAAEVYHTPYPGQARDALRLEATTEPGPHMETLAFYFPVVDSKEAVLRLHWGEVIVPLSIRVR